MKLLQSISYFCPNQSQTSAAGAHPGPVILSSHTVCSSLHRPTHPRPFFLSPQRRHQHPPWLSCRRPRPAHPPQTPMVIMLHRLNNQHPWYARPPSSHVTKTIMTFLSSSSPPCLISLTNLTVRGISQGINGHSPSPAICTIL